MILFKVLVGFALVIFAIPIILSASVLILGLYVELHSSFITVLITFIGIEVLWFYTLVIGRKKETERSS